MQSTRSYVYRSGVLDITALSNRRATVKNEGLLRNVRDNPHSKETRTTKQEVRSKKQECTQIRPLKPRRDTYLKEREMTRACSAKVTHRGREAWKLNRSARTRVPPGADQRGVAECSQEGAKPQAAARHRLVAISSRLRAFSQIGRQRTALSLRARLVGIGPC